MPFTTTFLVPLTVLGALACLPSMVNGAAAMPAQRFAMQTAAPGWVQVHDVHHAKRHAHRAPSRELNMRSGEPYDGASEALGGTRGYRAQTGGDTSGFPGGNEFNPSAPFGGQAAVTAPPGTDAYKEQMIQRRDFCEYASNRC